MKNAVAWVYESGSHVSKGSEGRRCVCALPAEGCRGHLPHEEGELGVMPMKKRGTKGFTLIGLLAVIVMIAAWMSVSARAA